MADEPKDPKGYQPRPITEAVTSCRYLANTLGSTVRAFEAGHVETPADRQRHAAVIYHAINRLNELAALLDRQDARETRLEPTERRKARRERSSGTEDGDSGDAADPEASGPDGATE